MKKFGFVVVVFALLLFVASSLSYSSSTEELEGTLEVIMATKVSEKKCEPLYFVNTSGKRTQFSLPAHAPPLSPGQKIKISGRWEDKDGKKGFHCRKIAPAVTTKTTSLAYSASDYLPKQTPVSGKQNILVVYLSSSDTEEDLPSWDKEKIDDKIFSNKHSLNAYWKACSINNKTDEPQVWLAGDILDGWRKMPKKWSDYGYGSKEERDHGNEFLNDLISLLDPEVDFSLYDGLVVFRAGKKWAYDWSTVGKLELSTDDGENIFFSMSFLNENDIEISNDYAAHETGHGLFSRRHSDSVSILSGKIRSYGDWWENRGAQYALLDGLNRYVLGWLDISQIKVITSSDDIWLDQRELSSQGIKLLVIPLGRDDDGNPILLYFEYHRGLGEFDSQLSFPNTNASVDPNNIVLIRKNEWNGSSFSRVYVASDDGNDCLDLESDEFCDSEYENLDHYGVCVQVLQKTGEDADSKAEVRIKFTSSYLTPAPISSPTPTPSPSPTPTSTPIPSPTLSPTPILAEMTLDLSVKKVVRRGGKASIKVVVTDTGNNLLSVDKISCKMTKSNETWLYGVERNTAKARFTFRVRKKDPPGRYKITATASKEGYKDAVSEKFFKVK